MSEKILVSGFDEFGWSKRPNPSSRVALPAIKEKYGECVETLVLPTERTTAANQLIEAIEDVDPLAIVMFGVTAGKKVLLEKRAKNIKFNLFISDNSNVRSAGLIAKNGPWHYASSLPLDNIHDRLNTFEIPTRMSTSAGMFICNEVMYKTLHHNAISDATTTPTGFIHLGNKLDNPTIEEASILVVDEVLKLHQVN